MSDWFADVVFTWRCTVRKPATALLIVITLALGIGANTAMLSMTYHVLLAPLPYADGDRLVTLKQNNTTTGRQDMRWLVPTVVDYRAQNTVFSDLLGYFQEEYTLLGHDAPYFAKTGVVNWDYFNVLGIQPELGRTFVNTDDQPGAQAVMLLGHEFWVSRFAEDTAVIGSSLEMNDIVYTVVGVLEETPPYPRSNDVWIPAAVDIVMSNEQVQENRSDITGGTMSLVLGKLHENISLEEAGNDIATITQRLQAAYPETYTEGYTIVLRDLKDELVGNSGAMLVLLLALALLVLLIACANVANINLAKLAARNQELAIREAVGASHGRIVRQLLTESMLLALAGGGVGLVVAYQTLQLLSTFTSGFTPLAGPITMNSSVLIFALCIALLTGIVSGAAASFGRRDLNTALKEGGDKLTASTAGRYRRQVLLVVQLGLAFVMLTATALITLSLYRLNNQYPGYDPEQVLVLNTQLNHNYPAFEDALDFVARLLAEVRALPGVEAAAVARLPLLQNPDYGAASIAIEGRAETDPAGHGTAFWTMVTEDYFRVMSIPLLEGRMFTAEDDINAPGVVIINEIFARSFFPAGNALGQKITFSDQTSRTVVGIVGNIRGVDLDRVEGPAFYSNFMQGPASVLNLFVKSRTSLDELKNTVTAVIHEMDPLLAIGNAGPLEEFKSAWLAPRQLMAALVGLFGVLALVVTCAGVLGVVSYNISRRVREIGIHMAIGAAPARITRIFVAEGLQVYAGGLLLGLTLMLAGAPFIQTLLYQTEAVVPALYLASLLVLTTTVVIAMYLPARKASVMSPAEALHFE